MTAKKRGQLHRERLARQQERKAYKPVKMATAKYVNTNEVFSDAQAKSARSRPYYPKGEKTDFAFYEGRDRDNYNHKALTDKV